MQPSGQGIDASVLEMKWCYVFGAFLSSGFHQDPEKVPDLGNSFCLYSYAEELPFSCRILLDKNHQSGKKGSNLLQERKILLIFSL